MKAFDRKEYDRWLRQADYTLESARDDFDRMKFSWSCFKAQQAAEYALKGILYGLGVIPAGHSLLRLLSLLRRKNIGVEEAMRHARALDRHYIPARYPNAHPEGAPFEYYDEETAGEAIHSAEFLIGLVREAAKSWL